MTSKERILRMYQHKEADRVPIIDSPWDGTIARWHREGMPENADWRDYFGVDKFQNFSVDISPRYEVKVLEETDRYIIRTSPWGVTYKSFKELDSTPEYLDFKVTDSAIWQDTKSRMDVSKDRINWNQLKENFPLWEKEGSFKRTTFWFGFDVAHSHMTGTETMLITLLEEPEWAADMFNTFLDRAIALNDMIWDEGYRFDSISYYDDLGYKNTTFFSGEIYRDLLKGVHKRAVDWAHDHGMMAELHSCGYIKPHLPDIVETGIDGLNPIEIKAGMDVLEVKRDYGDKLTLRGGMDAVIFDKADIIVPHIEKILPKLKENGGYIFSSDHSIPNSVSLETYKSIVETVKAAGKY